MIKSLILQTFFVFSVFICPAQSTFLVQNVNVRAKELKHELNSSKDTLILNGERTIFNVAIFNDKYDFSQEVNDTSTRIGLNALPMGRFVVQATLIDKLIIMTLVRHDKRKTNQINSPLEVVDLSEPRGIGFAQSELRNYTSENIYQRIPRLADIGALERIPKSYWVEYIISNGNSSYKTLRFASKDMVDKMIAKNRTEIKSIKGKSNKLTIWEIYDTTKFLRFKRLTPNFSEVSESEFFNIKPYYDSKMLMAEI